MPDHLRAWHDRCCHCRTQLDTLRIQCHCAHENCRHVGLGCRCVTEFDRRLESILCHGTRQSPGTRARHITGVQLPACYFGGAIPRDVRYKGATFLCVDVARAGICNQLWAPVRQCVPFGLEGAVGAALVIGDASVE